MKVDFLGGVRVVKEKIRKKGKILMKNQKMAWLNLKMDLKR